MVVKKNNNRTGSSYLLDIKRSCIEPDVDFTLCIFRPSVSSDLLVLKACREAAGESLIEVPIDSSKLTPLYDKEINEALVLNLPDEYLGRKRVDRIIEVEPEEKVGFNIVSAFGKDLSMEGKFDFDDILRGFSNYKEFVRLSSLRVDVTDVGFNESFIRHELNLQGRDRYFCFRDTECELFIRESGNQEKIVKSEKDFEVVDMNDGVVIDDNAERQPLELVFETVYPSWVHNGNSALIAFEDGHTVDVSKSTYEREFSYVKDEEVLFLKIKNQLDERNLLFRILYTGKLYDLDSDSEIVSEVCDDDFYKYHVDKALKGISSSLFLDKSLANDLSDVEKESFLRKVFNSSEISDFSFVQSHSNPNMYCFMAKDGKENKVVEISRSKGGLPLVVVGDKVLHQFRDEKIYRYRGFDFNAGIFGDVYNASPFMDKRNGDYLSVMLGNDFSYDSLRKFAKSFVGQFLNDRDVISFSKSEDVFDYGSDTYNLVETKGECSLREFFDGLNGKNDNWFSSSSFVGCRVDIKMKGNEMDFIAYTGGYHYNPSFKLFVDKKIFPECNICIRDKHRCVLDARERKSSKHYHGRGF